MAMMTMAKVGKVSMEASTGAIQEQEKEKGKKETRRRRRRSF